MRRRQFLPAALIAPMAIWCGCGGPRNDAGENASRPFADVEVRRCELDVELTPATHRIEATARLALSRPTGATGDGTDANNGEQSSATDDGLPARLRLQLHSDLTIESIVDGNGAAVVFKRVAAEPSDAREDGAADDSPHDDSEDTAPALYDVEPPTGGFDGAVLAVRYAGALVQDVAAGERAGEIHNFAMRAHIGEEGIYLDEGGDWYPTVAGGADDSDDDDSSLTQFELTATEPEGMVLVASGNRVGAGIGVERGRRTTWRSPFPLTGMVLVGGRHVVHQQQVGDVLVSVHVSQEHAAQAALILDAAQTYLTMYQPLVGPFPFREFTVFENFFSSGFGFPGFTALASAVIGMGEGGLRPGYLDHEMLHNWWGNGVFVSGRDGNWCECLTSYCANYMRHVLEGNEEEARKYRRGVCYGMSRMSAKRDRPLGAFGQEVGVSRFIGYDKGAMVFAMLADRIGQDVLWRSLRRLCDERLGKATTWDDIFAVIGAESGADLSSFVETWVRGGGAPTVELTDAAYDGRAGRVAVTLRQDADAVFDVEVPIRLTFAGGAASDHRIRLDRAAVVAMIDAPRAPIEAELDPDYRLLRRIARGDVMPTVSGISASKPLTIIRAEGDDEAYQVVVDRFAERYEEKEGKPPEHPMQTVMAEDVTEDDLSAGHVMILGRAQSAAAVRTAFAEALGEANLEIGDGGFALDGTRYDTPEHAVLCCLRHPKDEEAVVCLYVGNSADALKRAGLLTFYGGNSLIVFEAGKVVERRDFERRHRVSVVVDGRD